MFNRCQGVLGVVQGLFVCHEGLKLSCEVDECKPLVQGKSSISKNSRNAAMMSATLRGGGLPSSTSGLNLSAFCGIGVSLGIIYGVLQKCHGI